MSSGPAPPCSGSGAKHRRAPTLPRTKVDCTRQDVVRVWKRLVFYCRTPAPAPHLAHPEGCAALRIVLVTCPVSAALASISRMDSISTSCTCVETTPGNHQHAHAVIGQQPWESLARPRCCSLLCQGTRGVVLRYGWERCFVFAARPGVPHL